MRILFYLPAATPQWFTHIVVPMLRTAIYSAEVHAIIMPEWNGTGFTDETLGAACFDLLDKVNWHVLGGPDHPSYRTRPADPEGLIAAVREINADYTFCRSADVTTPAQFPGKVSFIMEGEFAPALQGSVPPCGRAVVQGPRFYDFGFVPELDSDARERLDRLIEPAWRSIATLCAQDADRNRFLSTLGLPHDRKIITLPLQHQGSDNVLTQVHGLEEPADQLVARIAAEADDDWLLAVAVHPIDRRLGTGGPIDRIAAMDMDRVRIVDFPPDRIKGEHTQRLIQHCDGLIVAESKAISLGAYFGKPILRLSRYATAEWVQAYKDLPSFRAALASGQPAVARPEDFRTWYAFHYANNAFRASQTLLPDLLDRVDRPVNPNRWEPALLAHDVEYVDREVVRFPLYDAAGNLNRRVRILFYLPAVTPNWFTDNIVPLIRSAMEADALVHVIVTPSWNGTGITDDELATCPDLLETVHWHVLDGEGHPSFRTRPDEPEDLLTLVCDIAPDYTFCRSADVTTPASYPGKVVYLMEAEFVPSLPASVPVSGRAMLSGPRFYDFGFVPELDADLREWLPGAVEPARLAIEALAAPHDDRARYLAKVGLPDDRKIIAVALQCQSADNVFGEVHSSEGPADLFVERIAAAAGDDWLIAVSLHPIDRRLGTAGPIARIAAMDPARVRIVDYPDESYRGEATERLIQHCDGLIVAESKAISLGVWYGKPILRLSSFATADWVNAYSDIAEFRDALAAGTAARPEREAMLLWYAYHFADQAFVPAETDLADLLDRVERPVNPERWERALALHTLQL